MTDDELRQLIASNARAIQAMLDARAQERQEFQDRMDRLQENIDHLQENIDYLQENTTRLQEVAERLAELQQGMVRMLASLDEDRPTILRKLNSIETKVDRLLQQQPDAESD